MKYLITDENVKAGPNAGTLFAAEQSYDGLYFVNNGQRKVRCGVDVEIPEGYMVEITGLYANECRNLAVIAHHLYGPFKGPLDVVVWNNSPGTIKLDPYCPIASIRAYALPKPAVWKDMGVEQAA